MTYRPFLICREVRAKEEEAIRVTWELEDGTVHVQFVICPPKEIRDVREWEQRMSVRKPVPFVTEDEVPLLRAKHLK